MSINTFVYRLGALISFLFLINQIKKASFSIDLTSKYNSEQKIYERVSVPNLKSITETHLNDYPKIEHDSTKENIYSFDHYLLDNLHLKGLTLSHIIRQGPLEERLLLEGEKAPSSVEEIPLFGLFGSMNLTKSSIFKKIEMITTTKNLDEIVLL